MSDKKHLRPSDHPNKIIRQALEEIMSDDHWELIDAGHWGSLRCKRDCECKIPVSGTPRVAERHARDLVKAARRCPLDEDSGYRKPRAR